MLKSEQEICTGFEIRNNFISSGSISRFIKRTPGCKVISKRKMFSKNEIHVTFNYKETEFQVWEPFGDNSRLLIGSEKETNEKTIFSLANEIQKTKCYFVC
ncbi:MAG: hypothetical protein HOE30_04335 [Deltaproteobacteria bacterium]|nr:hypothetical protein [Deltaproteobacteria bacterium]MBT6457173.1 hypothetical protein [Gammaproteobacteria bacterium]